MKELTKKQVLVYKDSKGGLRVLPDNAKREEVYFGTNKDGKLIPIEKSRVINGQFYEIKKGSDFLKKVTAKKLGYLILIKGKDGKDFNIFVDNKDVKIETVIFDSEHPLGILKNK